MKWTLSIASAALVVSITSTAAQASMARDVYQAYSNATPAQSYSTRYSNGIALGSYMQRIPLVDRPVANFSPPGLSASCQGLDMWGGSFSYINSDQLEQMVRAAMQGAPYYAFSLAISSLCPTCKQIADDIQSIIGDMNKFMRNLCQNTGAYLADNTGLSSAKIESGALTSIQSMTGAARGFFSDPMSSLTDPETNTQQKNVDNGVNVTSNIIWDLIVSSKLDTTSGPISSLSGTSLAQLLMSMVPIKILKPNGDNGADSSGLDFIDYPALISLSDIINGSDEFQTWDCSGDLVSCVNPTMTAPTNFKGIRDELIEDFEQIVMAMQNQATAMSTDLMNLAAASRLNVQQTIDFYGGWAAEPNTVATLLAEAHIQKIASDIYYLFDLELMNKLRSAQLDSEKEHLRGDAEKLLQTATKRLEIDHLELRAAYMSKLEEARTHSAIAQLQGD